ncbi:hypothetical protein QF045_001794 [Pseudomonas sp. W4I3]|nr:hypothetical protein [Pseudomonas sp. W4I3]
MMWFGRWVMTITKSVVMTRVPMIRPVRFCGTHFMARQIAAQQGPEKRPFESRNRGEK